MRSKQASTVEVPSGKRDRERTKRARSLRSRVISAIVSIALAALWPGAASAQQIGQVLPPWSPGTLDIHQINTGKGDSAFFIFPDGTTMLVDAGNGGRNPPRGTAPRPDANRTPGEWIARYIKRMLPHASAPVINYGYITHFHGDHMGSLYPNVKVSGSGEYKLTGIIDVGEQIPIRKMLDRGWPEYNFPRPLDNPMMENYRAFLEWQIADKGVKVQRLQPGRGDQIVLVHDARSYPNFEVRNIAANGEVWTGVGANTRQHFPPFGDLSRRDQPTENMCSMAIRISYGKFDYFTGGDMPGVPPEGAPVWHDVETPVARAVGPVEACVLNHHGNKDSMNAFFVSTLRPRVFIIPVWSSDHPGHRVLARLYSERLYPGPRDVFATNMIKANKIVIGSLLERLASDQGHIVIRVDPGGASYRVIILDDSAETYKVKAVHGPYESR